MRIFLYCFSFVCVNLCFAEVEHRCIIDLLESQTDSIPVYLESEDRQSPSLKAHTASAKEWKPIRIKFFTYDLNKEEQYCTANGQRRSDFNGNFLVCREGDVLTTHKKSLIVGHIMPAAIKLHTERLLVKPIPQTVKVPEKNFLLGSCSHFTIPPEHYSKGVTGADTLLYVAGAPITAPVRSWGVSCAYLRSTGRPIQGVINFSPLFVDKSRQSVRIAAHGIAHVLGFTYRYMVTGLLLSSQKNVRGKDKVLIVHGPKTAEKARSHYNCSDLAGVELEDEGGMSYASSHLESRTAKGELMSLNPTSGSYTALTMGIFEDLGYYRGQWGNEEHMLWGNASGCSFLKKPCISEGATKFPDMFCTSKNKSLQCTTDRMALGVCSIFEYNKPVAPEYRYFKSPRISGIMETHTDLCPVIMAEPLTMCNTDKGTALKGSRLGHNSRCVKGESLQFGGDSIDDICAEISCKNRQVSIRVFGDDTWHLCPQGNYIRPNAPFTNGKIICPSYGEVCSFLIGEKGKYVDSGSGSTGESENSSSSEDLTSLSGGRRPGLNSDKTEANLYKVNFIFLFVWGCVALF